MKTSSISQRVADFLKEHPPFDFMEEKDLLLLASKGRVKFHESDEIVFKNGDTRSRWLYVIQQGTIKIFREAKEGDELVDVRVEGDLLGVFWVVRSDKYMHTAKTTSDTILYALDWEHFVEIAKGYPKVKRYLAAYFSLEEGYDDESTEDENYASEDLPGLDGWMQMTGNLVSNEAKSRLLTCSADLPIKAMASMLSPGYQEVCVITDTKGLPLGLVDEGDLLRLVATGKVSVDEPVGSIMVKDFISVAPGLPLGDIILKFLKHRVSFLCITQDGTHETPVMGTLAESFIQLYHGRLPTSLNNEIIQSASVDKLAVLRNRADELLLYYLENDVHINWVADYIVEVDNAIAERALLFAEKALASEGLTKPDIDYAWLAMHSEGRRERFIRSEQRTGIIYQDCGSNAEECQAWLLKLAAKVSDVLEQCGFAKSVVGLMASNPQWCKSFSEWEATFIKWIEDPIDNSIITRISFFDMRVVVGEPDLVDKLRQSIYTHFEKNPAFIPLIANDAMENLPPVTIFRDTVMDKSGVHWTSINTKQHALLPLVDIARVYALRYGIFSNTSTVERFEELAIILPREHRLFEEAAEAMRAALSLQSIMGLRRGDNGQYIRADELDKIDQERFKSVFRTIISLMEFTEKHFNLVK